MWGFHPHTPTYFFLVEKVGKNTHGGETLSMGFLPRDPLIRDDTKGGASPPLETPAYPPVSLFDGGSASQGLPAGSPAFKRFRQRRKPWRKGGFIPPAQMKS